MPGDHSEPTEPHLAVAEAALALGCSAQTVRNMLKDGRLQGSRIQLGRRAGIYRVAQSSIDAYLRENGPVRRPARERVHVAIDQVADLQARIRALEQRVGPADMPDPVNLTFANLRLMEIHEEYERAVHDLLTADEHRDRALASMQKVAASFRAVVQQFHLPTTPPQDH